MANNKHDAVLLAQINNINGITRYR